MTTIQPTMFGTLRRYAAAIRAVSREIRTERQIADLPDYLRKDIGWPDAERVRRRHAGAGQGSA